MPTPAPSIPWMYMLSSAIFGGLAAAFCGGYVAVEFNRWYEVVGWEKAAGSFVLSYAFRAMWAGVFIGLLTAYLLPGGSGRKVLVTLGLVVLLSWCAWAVAGMEAPPMIDGEPLNLLVELRGPAGWKAPNAVKADRGRLQVTMPAARIVPVPTRAVDIDGQALQVDGERTVVPGRIVLHGASAPRQVELALGTEKVVFALPMPATPGAEMQSWSGWAAAGNGFDYRFRVERVKDTEARAQAAASARQEALRARVAALGTTAAATAYLDLYENDLYREYELKHGDETSKILQRRWTELVPLVSSRKYSRYAIPVVMRMEDPLPVAFETPLREALPVLLEEIQALRAGDPKDPDLRMDGAVSSHFESWLTTWKRLGRPFPPELRQVGEAAAGLPEGSLLSDVPRRVGELMAPSF